MPTHDPYRPSPNDTTFGAIEEGATFLALVYDCESGPDVYAGGNVYTKINSREATKEPNSTVQVFPVHAPVRVV